MPRSRLFLVPGNHDIDRSIEEDAYNGVRRTLVTTTDTDAFFSKESRRRSLFRRQAAYRQFANRVTGSDRLTESSYHHHCDIAVGHVRVRVLLIDSAWLAGADDDMGNLLVGERQLLEAAASGRAEAAHLTFLLIHHPFSWLRECESLAIENGVVEAADICLRGHVHISDQRASETPEGRIAIFTAGAAFETRTSDNTYNWCSLDLLSGGGTIMPHRYVAARKKWEASEARPWTLATKPDSLPLTVASSVASGRCKFPNYTACLLSGVAADVPIRIGDSECFANATATIPGVDNAVGTLVGRLWYHCHWRDIWEANPWLTKCQELLGELDELLALFALSQTELQRRESQCSTIVAAVAPAKTQILAELQDEIGALLSDGDAANARRVLERWETDTLSSEAEQWQLLRLSVDVLLAERRIFDALAAAKLLASKTGDVADMALQQVTVDVIETA